MSGALLLALLLPALSWGAPDAAAPLELTLDKAISLGLEHNLDIALAQERLAFLEAQRRQAIGAALPSVTITGSYDRNIEKPKFFLGGQSITAASDNSMRHIASLQQYLFAGGVVSEGMRAARIAVEGGKKQTQAAREDVVLAVQRLFYAVCLASETAAIERDSLTSAEDHLQTIRERYRQGMDSDLTVLRQEVEVANAQPALLAARNSHELSLTLLKDSLGLDVDAPVRVVGSLDGDMTELPSYERLQASAEQRNPDCQAAQKQLEQAEAMLNVSKGGHWPMLSLYSDYEWYSQSDAGWPRSNEQAGSSVVGLRLSYPLFTGGQTSAKIEQSRAQRDQALTSLEKVQRSIRVEVKREWLAVHEAQERAQSQSAAIAQARRALEATEVRYRAGEAGLLELNDATLALQKTRLLYANALHDYRVALAALDRAAGPPLKETAR